jgi:hypothetical protein
MNFERFNRFVVVIGYNHNEINLDEFDISVSHYGIRSSPKTFANDREFLQSIKQPILGYLYLSSSGYTWILKTFSIVKN